MSQADPISALWESLVELSETGHEAVVIAQRRPTLRNAIAVRAIASDMATLARAAEIIAKRRRSQR